jgi:preprotein translocase subunit SecF
MGFYDSKRGYKYAMLITIGLFVVCVGMLLNGYMQTGEWFQRSIDLRGGSIITIKTDATVTTADITRALSNDLGGVSVASFSGFAGSGFQITGRQDMNSTLVLEKLRSSGIGVHDFSTATMGPALSESFWAQAQVALLFAFILMGIVVFAVFRTFAPSIMVISCAIFDIVETIAFMQVFGIQLSLAGLAAVLMLIGYSVDTDILLTNRLLRNAGEIKEKTKGAIKTGLTMTFTTIGALTALLLSGLSPVLSQIAAILLIGMAVDILNTWIQNYGLLRLYMERKGMT